MTSIESVTLEVADLTAAAPPAMGSGTAAAERMRTIRVHRAHEAGGVREAVRALEAVASERQAAPVNRPMTDGAPPRGEGLSTMRLEET